MRFLLYLTVTAVMFFCVLTPERASAQLFRGLQRNDARGNFSNLPGADPYARRPPDYGAENVSEVIRNEVNGRAQVRPVPDFLSDAPMARAMKQAQFPFTYTVQRPTGDDSRVQSPLTRYSNRLVPYPYWVDQATANLPTVQGGAATP